jgi:ABC-type transport system involved in multi-copper enzyme maturation permease subunit
MLRLLGLFLGPVFAKEMIEMARRKRYYLNRVFYGLVLLFSLFIVWEEYRWQIQRSSGISIKMMARMAAAQFTAIGSVQFFGALLLVPLFLCGVIASEREERTLELLFTTQLTDREIVLGKLMSRIVVLVLLILTALPILGMILFFGGVDPDSLWRMNAVTLLATLYASAHAIYFSASTRSPIGALVRTYWWMAVWLAAVPMATMMLVAAFYIGTRGPPGPLFYYAMGGIIATNPIGPYVAALNTFMYNDMRSALGSSEIADWFFPLSFVVPSGWSVFLIWRAIRRLRLAPTPFAAFWSKITWIGRLVWKRRRTEQKDMPSQLTPVQNNQVGLIDNLWAALAWLGRHRTTRACFGLLGISNPLWIRARQARVYDREGTIGKIQWAGWGLAFLFFCLLALVERRAVTEREASMVFAVPIWLALAGLAAIFSGASLVGDRRRGFLDLVLMTPLRPGEILDGTVLAVWQHWRRLYWLAVVMGLIFCLTGSTVFPGLMLSLITGTLFCLLLIMHGTACSLTAQTFPAALVSTFSFPLFMLVGVVVLTAPFRHGSAPVLWITTVIGLPLAWYWARRRVTPASFAAYLLFVHLALCSLATGWTAAKSRHEEYPMAAMHPGFLTISTLNGHTDRWSQDGVDKEVLLPCYWAALIVNIIWLRWWTIRNFDRITGRARPRTAVARPVHSVRPVPRTEFVEAPGARGQESGVSRQEL